MKTITAPRSRSSHTRRGSAVVVVLALLSIMMIMITADFITSNTLQSDLKLIEKNQVQRLEGRPPDARPGLTNAQPRR